MSEAGGLIHSLLIGKRSRRKQVIYGGAWNRPVDVGARDANVADINFRSIWGVGRSEKGIACVSAAVKESLRRNNRWTRG